MIEYVEMPEHPPCTVDYLVKSVRVMRAVLTELHDVVPTHNQGHFPMPLAFDSALEKPDTYLAAQPLNWFAEVLWQYGRAMHSLALTARYGARESHLGRQLSGYLENPGISTMVFINDARGKKFNAVGKLFCIDQELYGEDVNALEKGEPIELYDEDGGPKPRSPRYCLTLLDGSEMSWGNCMPLRLPMLREITYAYNDRLPPWIRNPTCLNT